MTYRLVSLLLIVAISAHGQLPEVTVTRGVSRASPDKEDARLYEQTAAFLLELASDLDPEEAQAKFGGLEMTRRFIFDLLKHDLLTIATITSGNPGLALNAMSNSKRVITDGDPVASIIPQNLIIARDGAFYNPTRRVCVEPKGSAKVYYAGATPFARALLILHELLHQLAADLEEEPLSPDASCLFNGQVLVSFPKTLAKLSKKQEE